jgi:hypothetical protein
MPEIIIQYKNSKTLQLLNDLSKYFDFTIRRYDQNQEPEQIINGVTLIPPDESIDISNLTKIFSSRNIDAQN